jgi:hypothetical protein
MQKMMFVTALAVGLLATPLLKAQGSDSIRAEQQALKDKGFDPGPVDGMSGRQTKEALKHFQDQQNLHEDGRLGPQTRDALGLKEGSAKTDMRESGENMKTGYGKGGKDIGHGSVGMVHDVGHGHPVEGAKDFGKGIGHGVAKMGEGTGHAAKNVGKGVKNAVTGDHKDTSK